MALNGLKMWGAYVKRCKVCLNEFLAKKAHFRYCSPECRTAGLGRIKRVSARAIYMQTEMDSRRLAERLESIARLPAMNINLHPRLAIARRMMAYA